MRITSEIEDISYRNTQDFFSRRAQKYNKNNPYAVTMYQDNNPELVKSRNKKEIETLKPLLQLNESSKVLDIACGIGRWSDAITEKISGYCGIDFCHDFIELAKGRNTKLQNRSFFCSPSPELEICITANNLGLFNTVLIIGGLVYLNDEDVLSTLSQVSNVCESKALICIREPIGINDRLTLKEQFSDELNDTYNAIYRTRNELVELFSETLFRRGFKITCEDYMFSNKELNNRKETSQYYFIIKRDN